MSIGEFLAEARRRAGFGVAQVSQLTGISEAIITGIEDDDFSACGGEFYARRDIRSIARAVGADPEPLIEEYDAARAGPQPLAGEVTEPFPPLRIPQHPRPEPATATESPQRRPPAGPVMPMESPQRRPPAGPVMPMESPQRRPPGKPLTPAGRHNRGRRRPAWAVALGVAVVAGLGFAGYLLANPGHSTAPSAGAHPATPHPPGRASHAASAAATAAASTPAAPGPAPTPARPLTPASATALGSAGGPGDNSGLARLAIDGNPATDWHTDWYTTAQFGNLYPGTGLLVDMGRPVTITTARITLGPARGASFQLRVGAAPALARLRPVAHAANAGGVVRLRLTPPAHGRYVLIWFTSLPPDLAGTFQAKVYSLQLQGRT